MTMTFFFSPSFKVTRKEEHTKKATRDIPYKAHFAKNSLGGIKSLESAAFVSFSTCS